MAEFEFKANLREIAAKVGQTADAIGSTVQDEIRKLSIATHAFVVNHANEHLSGWKRSHFFGSDNQNVRWVQIDENMWVVEIDPSVAWIEEGRDATSMATDKWLLKPDKAKLAKDGSTYRVIPMDAKKDNRRNPELKNILNDQLQKQGVDMSTLDLDGSGQPKLGVIKKLNFGTNVTEKSSSNEMFFSAPRSAEQGKKLGLPAYGGKHQLQGAVVTQRKDERGGVKKEATTFRVVSSKHEAEGRWMYPKVEPLDSIPKAYEFAEQQWNKIVAALEESFKGD